MIKGANRYGRPHCREESDAAGTAAAAGGAGRAALAGKGLTGFDRESHIGKVNVHAAYSVKKFLFNAECEAVRFNHGIVVFGLVQSQSQPRAASASRRQIHTNARLGLVGKKRLKFLAGIFRQFNHDSSRFKESMRGKN